MNAQQMSGVREYSEGDSVDLDLRQSDDKKDGDGRFVIIASNQGGHDCTQVDLLDLLVWIRTYRPEIWKSVNEVGA